MPHNAWFNIHFGTIGKYCEFSEIVLLGGVFAGGFAWYFGISNFFEDDSDEDWYKNCTVWKNRSFDNTIICYNFSNEFYTIIIF